MDDFIDVTYEEVKKEEKHINGKILYYSTSQVATILEQSDSKIRYYTNVFDDMLKIEISNKQRRYTDKDIDKLRFIIDLKNQGMTLKQIKEYCQEVEYEKNGELQIKDNNPLSIQTLATALMEEQRKQLEEFKSELIKEVGFELQKQINILQNYNEDLQNKVVEQVAITVDETINQKLEQSNIELNEKIQKINESLKKLEQRDLELVAELKEDLELKKQQYEEKLQNENNKSFFKRLFNK